jgi:hypothetical protein
LRSASDDIGIPGLLGVWTDRGRTRLITARGPFLAFRRDLVCLTFGADHPYSIEGVPNSPASRPNGRVQAVRNSLYLKAVRRLCQIACYNLYMESVYAALQNASQEFRLELAAAIFLAYICIDALAAWYTLMITKLNAPKAALADFFIYILISFGVINYTQNFLYIVPMAIGGSLGTYLVVRWHRKIKRKVPRRHQVRARKKIR